MNLFINAVSYSWILILFNEDREITAKKHIEILWNESSKLITYIGAFLKENNTSYNDLENIVVVNGPWSFTWVRTIVLAVNTINYIIKKNITPLGFFELFNNYPILKASSRRDLFVKYEKNASIDIVMNEDFLENVQDNNIDVFYWDVSNNIIWTQISVITSIDYKKIIEKLEFQEKKIIEPLYIKKPNIS